MPNEIKEVTLTVGHGGDNQKVAISTSSAQSAALTSTDSGLLSVVVYSDVDCFVRQGANPTALSTGVDRLIPAFTLIRLDGIINGNKLAIITAAGSGNFYIGAPNK